MGPPARRLSRSLSRSGAAWARFQIPLGKKTVTPWSLLPDLSPGDLVLI